MQAQVAANCAAWLQAASTAVLTLLTAVYASLVYRQLIQEEKRRQEEARQAMLAVLMELSDNRGPVPWDYRTARLLLAGAYGGAVPAGHVLQISDSTLGAIVAAYGRIHSYNARYQAAITAGKHEHYLKHNAPLDSWKEAQQAIAKATEALASDPITSGLSAPEEIGDEGN